MNDSLVEVLAPGRGDIMAVVGCGGKTSLIKTLAMEKASAGWKVLVMPTTMIRPMAGPDVTLCDSLKACLAHRPAEGIQCLGVYDKALGKLKSPPGEYLEQLAQGYDLVLMEADGSRHLPCKGWREDEPAVPAFTTRTVAVVPITGLGVQADEEHVLRLPRFLALCGLEKGDMVDLRALAAMVAAPGGMLKNKAGRTDVIINRADSPAALIQAGRLAVLIRAEYPGAADGFYAGTLFPDSWEAV